MKKICVLSLMLTLAFFSSASHAIAGGYGGHGNHHKPGKHNRKAKCCFKNCVGVSIDSNCQPWAVLLCPEGTEPQTVGELKNELFVVEVGSKICKRKLKPGSYCCYIFNANIFPRLNAMEDDDRVPETVYTVGRNDQDCFQLYRGDKLCWDISKGTLISDSDEE